MEKSKTTNGKNALIDVVTTREEKRGEHKVCYDMSGWKELKQRRD